MSLNDIDKSDNQRRFPQPNANDNVPHRMAHNTYGNTLRQVNSTVTPRMRFLNGLIVTYDSNNKVSSVYGYIPEISNTPVHIIANQDYDVFEDILDITAPTV